MKEDVHAAIVKKHSGARIWCPVVQNLYEHCRQAVREYAGPTSGLCLFPCLQLEGASSHARAYEPDLTWVPLSYLGAPRLAAHRASQPSRMLLTGLWSNGLS